MEGEVARGGRGAAGRPDAARGTRAAGGRRDERGKKGRKEGRQEGASQREPKGSRGLLEGTNSTAAIPYSGDPGGLEVEGIGQRPVKLFRKLAPRRWQNRMTKIRVAETQSFVANQQEITERRSNPVRASSASR